MSTNTDNTKIMGSEYFLKNNALKYSALTFVFPTIAPKLQSVSIYHIVKLFLTSPKEIKTV